MHGTLGRLVFLFGGRKRSAQGHGETWEIGSFDVDTKAFHIHLDKWRSQAPKLKPWIMDRIMRIIKYQDYKIYKHTITIHNHTIFKSMDSNSFTAGRWPVALHCQRLPTVLVHQGYLACDPCVRVEMGMWHFHNL